MSFDYVLAPPPEPGRFSDEALTAMRQWWERYPGVVEDDGTLMIYPSAEVRDWRRARHAEDPTRNDYLTSYVYLAHQDVELSVTGETVTTPWIYEFVVEAQSRWSATLLYFGKPVPADDILAEAD